MDFSALKRNSTANFEKLKQEVASQNKKFGDEDDRFWKLTLDKAKNGFAIIRFLPAPPGEDMPFVKYYDHGFQGPGGWYIERSLTSIGKDDPVSEYNSKLWETGIEANKDEARKQKRRVHYVANIYVVNDPANPANNGKVFKYRFGKKIFDMITAAMQPSEEEMALDPDLKPIPVFDFWEGANFKLKSHLADGWPSYTKSTFDRPGPLLDSDSELEKVWKTAHSLQEELSPSKYKTYEELEKKLRKVLKLDSKPETGNVVQRREIEKKEAEVDASVDVDDEIPFDRFDREKSASPKSTPKATVTASDDDDDDDSAFFDKLMSR